MWDSVLGVQWRSRHVDMILASQSAYLSVGEADTKHVITGVKIK